MADAEAQTKHILEYIQEHGCVEDSGVLAEQMGLEHSVVVGYIKSLEASESIVTEAIPHSRLALTPEADGYVNAGSSPEVVIYNAVPVDGGEMLTVQQSVDKPVWAVGFKKAMEKRWIKMDKQDGKQLLTRQVQSVEDTCLSNLQKVAAQQEVDDKAITELKKRKLVKVEQWKTFKVSKGPAFSVERVKQETDLTAELLQSGEWRNRKFKDYNFDALGLPLASGHLHPLLKVRTQFRKIFTQMGFSEMPTNNYVESSFWNFDALFQPQQHPARDAHDTFFLSEPATTPTSKVPQDYLDRVKSVHENGGFGSLGYGYHWKAADAEKNLLRTHTTAVSSRMLYRLAQEGFRPAKYFSVDRVFRNEAIDRTHLAEFHQIEGLVCDRGLTLGHLIGTLHTFFSRLGLKKLRFKPAYNPYTEPSMEIFSYSEELGKWMEVGNSGMFRPEMLRPMGLPDDVNVIAWGLSLERPTMILYGIGNIRDLFGHKVSLSMVNKNPICRLGL
eukprot:jgi/Ulvmu1/4862/UM020_0148.1